ncbi:MAG: PAS domain S-box protein [Armatimonadetes bacterium]|nr:PAS domain S-box protein [Armatimonadota bacterium]
MDANESWSGRKMIFAGMLGLVLLAWGGLLAAEWFWIQQQFSELAAAQEIAELQRREIHLYLEAAVGQPHAPALLEETRARVEYLLGRWSSPDFRASAADQERLRQAGAELMGVDPSEALSLYESELAPMERAIAAGQVSRARSESITSALRRAQAEAAALVIAASLPILLLLLGRSRAVDPPVLAAEETQPANLQGLAESFTRIARDMRSTTRVISTRAYTDRILRSISNLLVVISPTGRILAVNGATCDTLEYREDELVGQPLSLILEQARDPLLQLSHRNLEVTFLARGGRRIPALISCSIVRGEDDQIQGVVVTAQDISDRKEAEGALRESEERFRAIFTASALGIGRLDLQGRLAHANNALRRTLQLEATATPLPALAEFVHPEDRCEQMELFRQLAAGDRDSFQRECRFFSSSGELIWANTICSLVRDGDARPRFAICMVEDITGRKAAEQELEGARQELEHYAHSLEDKENRLRRLLDRLVHAQEEERRTVAHDLHDGLLQYIVSAACHLKAFEKSLPVELQQRSQLIQGIERLHSAVSEGRRLVYNLRPAALDRFGLMKTLQQHLEQLRVEQDWEVELEVGLDSVKLEPAVETTVYRLVQEALNNARKHAHTDRVRVCLKVEEESVRIEVQDWGVGFDPALVRDGGVGLHSMRERAELIGGSFEVSSVPGEGTRIFARIPLLHPRT